MNVVVKFLLFALCMTLPISSFAMKHTEMDHGSMQMDGETIPLGEMVVDGVKGTAYLLDVSEAMAKHGMKTTHHLMINFTDTETGDAIVKGRAATKVKGADGKESKAFKMMSMAKAFGADLTLDQQGPYQFRIGTKLKDKKKRTFSFTLKE